MNVRSTVLALAVLNAVLLGLTVWSWAGIRSAEAQASGLADNYMFVTGRIQDENDALYVVDMRERTLHTFTFRRGTRELEYAGLRSLDRDFRHNRN